MKNKLTDLNNHLFAQLERLSDETLSADQVELETRRGAAIVDVSDQIIKAAAIQLQAAKMIAEHGGDVSGAKMLAGQVSGANSGFLGALALEARKQ